MYALRMICTLNNTDKRFLLILLCNFIKHFIPPALLTTAFLLHRKTVLRSQFYVFLSFIPFDLLKAFALGQNTWSIFMYRNFKPK